jgi:hypothetical protein
VSRRNDCEIDFRRLLGGGWAATLGAFEASARTKPLAKTALLTAIDDEGRVDTKPCVRHASDGSTWILWRDWPSWVYETPTGCRVTQGGSKADASHAMDDHIAQYYQGDIELDATA